MTDDELDARLRKAHDHLLNQIANDPTIQARSDEFLRKLANGELADLDATDDAPTNPGATSTSPVANADTPARDIRLWVGTWETDEHGPRVDLRQTDLRWSGDLSGYTPHGGPAEYGIPVWDDDSREIGEVRLSAEEAARLGRLLLDSAREEAEPS